MADQVDFDFSELNQLAADLTKANVTMPKKVQQAVEVTARKIKDAWKEKLKGTAGVPLGAYTITYDLDAKPGQGSSVISAEIGAERGRKQAPIVTVIEFGAPGNNLAPRGYGAGALQENQADFIKGLEIAIGDPL
jgi:hypothetical protein